MSMPRGHRDWVDWHADDRAPGSPLHRRLDEVRAQIRDAVGPAAAAGFRIVAMCAGQGEDLLGALDGHPSARASPRTTSSGASEVHRRARDTTGPLPAGPLFAFGG